MNRNDKGQFMPGKRSSPSTEFKPGMKPWNKGKTSYMGANVTSFKPGQTPKSANPLGTITRRINKGAIEYTINIDWRGNRKPHNSYKWYLWEVDNSEDRPANSVLWIKNGNADDMRVENFEVIDRAELMRRNSPNV